MYSVREVRWSEWSERHVSRHGVLPSEVEGVLFGRPRLVTKGRDDTVLMFGTSRSGRLLLVVTVEEGRGVALVVTARDMTEQEKRTFRRKGR